MFKQQDRSPLTCELVFVEEEVHVSVIARFLLEIKILIFKQLHPPTSSRAARLPPDHLYT